VEIEAGWKERFRIKTDNPALRIRNRIAAILVILFAEFLWIDKVKSNPLTRSLRILNGLKLRSRPLGLEALRWE